MYFGVLLIAIHLLLIVLLTEIISLEAGRGGEERETQNSCAIEVRIWREG